MNDLDRRDFLSLAGGGTAAALLGALPSASPAKAQGAAEEAMQFGLVTYLWGQDWDLPTLIANCETADVHGVELRTEHAHGVQPTLSAKQREDVKARFADSTVTCLGPGTNQKFDDPDRCMLKENIEGAKAFVRLSHDVGGSGVRSNPIHCIPKCLRKRHWSRSAGRSNRWDGSQPTGVRRFAWKCMDNVLRCR